MLVINFSYAYKDIADVIAGLSGNEIKQTEILDFTAAVSKSNDYTVYYPTDLDENSSLHKAAISEYIHEMGLLSRSEGKGHNIRSITLLGISAFWLTQISQKNPQDSVLKNFYYFKKLTSKLSFGGKKIVIVLPQLCAHFQSALRTFMLRLGVRDGDVSFNTNVRTRFSLRILLSYIRGFDARIREARKHVKALEGAVTQTSDLIFTSYPEGWKEDKRGDIVLSDIEKLSAEKRRHPKYCPVFFDYEALSSFKNDDKFDLSYFAYFPSGLQVARFFRDALMSYYRISRMDLDLDKITFVDNTALKYELLDVIHHKLEYFCNYIWLRNYFSRNKEAYNVFYQDEFFSTGRLISEALRHSGNPNIKAYGVQHGLFYEAHTVYFLTDNEIKDLGKHKGLPMPGKFIVWGNYFKDLFLSYNSLPQDYVVPAGYLNYMYKRKETRSTTDQPHKGTRLLWCNTLEVDAIRVYNNILREFVRMHPEVRIEVRFHPIVNLRKLFEEKLIDQDLKERFTYSEHKTIFDAIQHTDIVLTNSGSTIFLDGLVAGKPVFHFVNNDYYMGTLGQDEMEHIYTVSDMNKAYSDYRQGTAQAKQAGNILNLEMKEWDEILSS